MPFSLAKAALTDTTAGSSSGITISGIANHTSVTSRALPFINRRHDGAVVKGIEQKLIGASNLSAKLRPDRKKDDPAPADGHIRNGGLAEEFFLSQNPPTHQGIGQ